jgi:uncharacterized protein YkwD
MTLAATAAALAALAALSGATGADAPGAAYGPERRVAPSAVEAQALELARQRLARRDARPAISGALVAAARELAGRAAAGDPDPISRGRLSGALARALAHDYDVAAVLAIDAPEDAAAAVARSLPRAAATHLGAGAVERDGKAWVVLLLTDRKLRLDPFPRDVAPGARAVISGTVLPPIAHPRVFVTRPTGQVDEVGGGGERAFRIPLEFPGAGRHVVAVVGDGDGGPQVAGILTVSAGGAPLDPPAGPALRDAGDAAAAEAAVLDALNATRRRHGLPPLAADPELARAARRHSEAMARAGRVAHVVRGSGEVGERLRRAAIPYRVVAENVARDRTALDAHATVEESPAHLANVLRRGPTRAGIGIARAAPSADAAVYLTEILVEPPDDGADSPQTPDARVREALWRERTRLALPPLTSDPALDAIARDAAGEMRARDDTEAGGVAARALALRRSLAAVDVFVVSAPDEAIRSANLRDRRFGRVGVGVVSGESRRFGKGRLWIVAVYTD